jgi:hypothetical protein
MNNEIKAGCGNCWFNYNGKCNYKGYCDYTKHWSNTLQSQVPTTYVEEKDKRW